MPSHPTGSVDPASGLTTCAWEASSPCSGQWHACALHDQGLAAVPVADFLTWRFQPRMQADKCRTSSRSVKKELVIESPQQRKDAAQGEVEAEGPGPVLAKPKLIEPLDYENVIVQKKTQILNDCLREMLLFPYDDFQTATLRRQGRYMCSTVPADAQEEAQSLFVTECIKTYNSDWHLVNYKFEDYSGEFRQLPNKVAKLDKLPVHVYEVDEEVDKDEVGNCLQI